MYRELEACEACWHVCRELEACHRLEACRELEACEAEGRSAPGSRTSPGVSPPRLYIEPAYVSIRHHTSYVVEAVGKVQVYLPPACTYKPLLEP